MKYTKTKLKECFDFITKHQKDWRDPILRRVHKSMFSVDLVKEAIIYYTSTIPEITDNDVEGVPAPSREFFLVETHGYWSSPCAGV